MIALSAKFKLTINESKNLPTVEESKFKMQVNLGLSICRQTGITAVRLAFILLAKQVLLTLLDYSM